MDLLPGAGPAARRGRAPSTPVRPGSSRGCAPGPGRCSAPTPTSCSSPRDTLEQAGRPELAARRAARLLAGGAASVADLGCAAGTDTIALARAGARVVAVDRDPVARELTPPTPPRSGSPTGSRWSTPTSSTWWRTRRRRVPAATAATLDPGAAGRRTSAAGPRPLVAALVDGDRAARPRAGVGGQGGARASTTTGCPPAIEAEWVSVGGSIVEALLWGRGLVDHLAAGDPRARRAGARGDRRRRPRPGPGRGRCAAGCTSPTRR